MDDDEFAEHLSLRHTISQGTYTEVKVVRPRGEVVLVALEELAILGVLGVYVAEIVMRRGEVWGYSEMPLVSGVVCWVSSGKLGEKARMLTWSRDIFLCLRR